MVILLMMLLLFRMLGDFDEENVVEWMLVLLIC